MATETSDAYTLVIVESGAKAAKIQGFLGNKYKVMASVGHIRDLPSRAADVPERYKKEKWARTGVNVHKNFAPLYVISPTRKALVRELRRAAKNAAEIILATDPDREGEAIAWHLLEVLKPKVPVHRMVFHEITKDAILEALTSMRELDMDLVNAQEARRIMDRLYGFEVSPVLWRKVQPRLSAGRVQSVATRLIVERERDRIAFVPAHYWDLSASVSGHDAVQKEDVTFSATLTEVEGKRVATGRDFTDKGEIKDTVSLDDVVVIDAAGAQALAEGLPANTPLQVMAIEEKPYTRRPQPPFITSTLQQEAANKLRFSSARTMRIAQRLYENGFITYIRTDSTALSSSGLAAARAQAADYFGAQYLSATPQQYARKVKNAQEAHEAIRPAGDTFRTPDSLVDVLDPEQYKLYDLIWRRTLASQMKKAEGRTVTVRLQGYTQDAHSTQVLFSASGRTIINPGFLVAVGYSSASMGEQLPTLECGDEVSLLDCTPDEHTTHPPARYTEATLVRALEELGIGRPSTYATIIKTIEERNYVVKRGSAMVPTWVAFAVTRVLEEGFNRLVDYDYTSDMEDELDAIAAGNTARNDWLNAFYFGATKGGTQAKSVPGEGGLAGLVERGMENIDARKINSLHVFDDEDGVPVYVRNGKYGAYLERASSPQTADENGVQRATLPASVTPDELTPELAEQLFLVPPTGRQLGIDPKSGHTVVAKEGRYGPYITEIIPEEELAAAEEKGTELKPRTASLFSTMDIVKVTLDDALMLLSLPRILDDGTDEPIYVNNGPYGPYLKKGSDTRSLENEDAIFTVTVEQAKKILAEPKRRRGVRATGPLRSLGEDPVTKRPLVIKDGRFGLYVTDGETNASLRNTDTVDNLTPERASELLSERRATIAQKEEEAQTAGTAKKTTTRTTRTVKARTTKKRTTTRTRRSRSTSTRSKA